jgi:hypothetical protein
LANQFYPLGVKHFSQGDINYPSDTIKCALVTTSYTPAPTTDEFFNIVPGGAITAAGVALTSKTNAAGVLGAANVLFSSVSGSQSAYLVVYKDTGTSSTSQLILLYDTATGLPVTPNGGNINVAWSSGNLATLFKGLDEVEAKAVESLRKKLWKWLGLGSDWDTSAGGLWIPAPALSLG